MTSSLNDKYYDTNYISRGTLYTLNMENIYIFKPYIVNIFENAKRVSLQCKQDIQELDKEMENLVNKYS